MLSIRMAPTYMARVRAMIASVLIGMSPRPRKCDKPSAILPAVVGANNPYCLTIEFRLHADRRWNGDLASR
jgi:hypothetical protein